MVTIFVECAVRAVLITGGTAFVLWSLRIKTAAMRHAAWTAVVIAMLALPIWLAADLRVSVPVLRPGSLAIAEQTIDSERAVLEAPAIAAPNASSLGASTDREVLQSVNWQAVFVGMYVLGALVLLARLLVGTVQANHLRRHAALEQGRLTSGRCATPITVGWFRPALILPPDWPRWSAAKLAAVLTHEAAHARRHDPLVQWVALFNRAVFWFHPLSWWLERRLATLAEEACDAAVIAAGHSPEDYSDYLLDLARSLTREGRRLNVIGMAMPGSGLTKRMRQIFEGLPMTPVSRTRAICTVTLCAASSVMFAAATLAPRGSRPSAQLPSAKPAFEVASVKRCDPSGAAGGRGTGPGAPASPGRLQTECRTIVNLIQNAYIVFADGRMNPGWHASALPIEGEPAWNKSDQFQIEAKADGPATQEMMRGPMMQSLLEDRFKLKLRRETRQVPVYEMVVAQGGAKVKPFKLGEGTCTPFDLSAFPSKPLVPGRPSCGWKATRVDGLFRRDVEGITLDEVAARFFLLDRPVVNHTGIPGLVVFSVQNDDSDRASIFAAFKQQVGIELRPAMGPREFLVIDHVELPVPNEQVGTPSSRQAFDVASIKLSGEKASTITRVTPSGISYTGLTARMLIADAYAVKTLSMSSADAQARSVLDDRQRYDVEAKADHAVSRPQLQRMLQTLLADRFKLTLRHESKIESVYKLVSLPGGVKLRESAGDGDPACGPAPDGGAVCRHMTMAAFADVLTSHLSRVVVDETTLTAHYDFTLKLDGTPGLNQMRDAISGSADPGAAKAAWAAASNDWSGSSILMDIQKQLGLKLEADKAPVDNLVIVHLERPTPNQPSPIAPVGRAFGSTGTRQAQ